MPMSGGRLLFNIKVIHTNTNFGSINFNSLPIDVKKIYSLQY